MKKYLSLLLVLAVMLTFFAGCKEQVDGTGSPEDTDIVETTDGESPDDSETPGESETESPTGGEQTADPTDGTADPSASAGASSNPSSNPGPSSVPTSIQPTPRRTDTGYTLGEKDITIMASGKEFVIGKGTGVSGSAMAGWMIDKWKLKVTVKNNLLTGSGTYQEKMGRLLNSETVPELILNYEIDDNTKGSYVEFGKAGKLVDFNEYMFMLSNYENKIWKEKAPDMWNYVQKTLTDNGKLYVLPRRNYEMAYYMVCVDETYLKKLGVTALPSDWDAYYALMKKAVSQDSAAIPWTVTEGNPYYIINPIANSYGIACDSEYAWLTMNGEPNWAFSWEEYGLTLKTLNGMVTDKLVLTKDGKVFDDKGAQVTDPADPTKKIDDETWKQGIKNYTHFLAYERYEAVLSTIQNYANRGADGLDGRQWRISKVQPTHKGYKTAAQFFTGIQNKDFDSGTGIAITTKNCNDDLIKRLCAFVDYFASVEGEKTANGYNSSSAKYGLSLLGRGASTFSFMPEDRFDTKKTKRTMYDQYVEYEKISNTMISSGTACYNVKWGTNAIDAKAKKLNDLAKAFTTRYLNREITDSTHNTEWSKYIASLKSAGYTDVYNARVQQLKSLRSGGATMERVVSSAAKQSTKSKA